MTVDRMGGFSGALTIVMPKSLILLMFQLQPTLFRTPTNRQVGRLGPLPTASAESAPHWSPTVSPGSAIAHVERQQFHTHQCVICIQLLTAIPRMTLCGWVDASNRGRRWIDHRSCHHQKEHYAASCKSCRKQSEDAMYCHITWPDSSFVRRCDEVFKPEKQLVFWREWCSQDVYSFW